MSFLLLLIEDTNAGKEEADEAKVDGGEEGEEEEEEEEAEETRRDEDRDSCLSLQLSQLLPLHTFPI